MEQYDKEKEKEGSQCARGKQYFIALDKTSFPLFCHLKYYFYFNRSNEKWSSRVFGIRFYQ